MDEFANWPDNCEGLKIPPNVNMISFTTPWIDSETGEAVTPIPEVFLKAFGEKY